MAEHALHRHVVLAGFMGSGKTTLGRDVARRLGRLFLDADKVIEERTGRKIAEIFATDGEAAFRELETRTIRSLLDSRSNTVIAGGGGAVVQPATREALREAFVVHVPVDVGVAWTRVRNSDRPLARDEAMFRQLFAERAPLYAEVADAHADDVDGVILAAAGIHHEEGALDKLGDLVHGSGPVVVVTDENVWPHYVDRVTASLGDRLVHAYVLEPGEASKSHQVLDRLWNALRIDRGGTIVAIGGGCVTDVAGFVAATYLRGVSWVSVPTSLVGQVDAAIGGKTAIDIAGGKNLIGSFHWPSRVVIDEGALATLPERERRQGEAELVKTEILANRTLGVRGAAAYKAGICLQDPFDHGPRRWLNLGHTFAHALEAAAGFELTHGDAVALGLLAALRISGRDTKVVEERLNPQPVSVDIDRAFEALLRDKKSVGGAINLVLLGPDGPIVEPRPAELVRAELARLIA